MFLIEGTKPSDILRGAAIRLDKDMNIVGCAAIEQAISDASSNRYKEAWLMDTSSEEYKAEKECESYYLLMRAEENKIDGFWFYSSQDVDVRATTWGAERKQFNGSKKQHRIIALLLAADIAESEGN